MDHQDSITRRDMELMLSDEAAEPKALPFSVLEEVTCAFSDELVIGRGGFAVVYKGILENGTIAVKRFSNVYQYEREFQRETECLMRVRHKNIVRFLGYSVDTQRCIEEFNGKLVMADVQQRLLCFEYISNGSLSDFITDPSEGLEWRTRYKIIKGICEGLNYLHQVNIVHLDLKPANVLLDEDMTPKITDFGNSRCFEEGQTWVTATKVGGTLGYLAPEFCNGEITHKYDLYSLGVIVMEILTGRKGYHDVEDVLGMWSHQAHVSQWEQIRVCTEIGIDCTEFNPAKRPASTKHIMDRLLETESIPAVGPCEFLVLHQLVLCFPFEPNKVIMCQLKLANNTDKYVAFRLMGNSGESFLNLPLYCIVPPRSPYTLYVTTQEHKELPRKRNMDLILQSATILENDYIHPIQSQPDCYFQKAKEMGNVVDEITLKAFYTPQLGMIDSSRVEFKTQHMALEDAGFKPHHTSFEHTGSKPNHLTLQHLKDITNNFSDERILGKGGFGVVYKGVLQSGKAVAVKKLVYAMPTSQKQFENEVNLLMKLEHKNIVQLIGYCYETQHLHTPHEGKFVFAWNTESLLCLECMPNGSLERYISDASSGLDWHTRWKIIEGISFGLRYLHEQSDGPIVHLDLKPANILLDENMVPKISDFGLSRLFDNKQTIKTAVSGTLGYMPPEYLRGIITPMSDIFSFGVLIMEIITGHREYPYELKTSSEGFIELELKKWRNVLQEGPTFASLEIDCQQIKRCIQVGLVCVNLERTKRPTMKIITDMLQGLDIMDWYITNELSCHSIQEEP